MRTNASTINIGITSVPLNLNPLYSTDGNSQNIGRLIHRSLIDFDQKMQIRCNACESFEELIDEKSKNQKIIFKLRNDLKFWDGSEVVAEDVFKSWKIFMDPNSKSIHTRAFNNLEDIKVTGENTIEFTFREFSVENFSNLALLKIIKKKSNDEIVGSGSYEVLETLPLEVVISPVEGIGPVLKFKVIKDETTLALKVINNEIDIVLGGISPRKYNWLRQKAQNYRFQEIPGTNYKYMSFNHENKHLSDLSVRRALAHLIPRRDILKYKLHDTAVLSKGIFSPSFDKFFNNVQDIEFNPEVAKKLLRSAGYKKIEGEWKRNGEKIIIDWKVSNNKSTIEIANIVKSYFEKEGIQVNISVMEWGTFMKNVKRGNFDIIMGQWIGFTNQDMLKFIWHTESFPPKGANRGKYKNVEFDKYINMATAVIDEEKRINLYKKAQEIAEKDLAYFSLWHPNISWISHKCIVGLKLYPNGGYLGLENLNWGCKK